MESRPNRAFDLAVSVPWAIRPEMLSEILSISARENDVTADEIEAYANLSRERKGVEALLAEGGTRVDGTDTVVNRDGVAILPITGPIFPRANLFTEMSGATSIEQVARDFNAAMSDPSVNALILNIDSPGGQVNGINEFANMVYDARETKPIGAYVRSDGASAAYWIASAAETIVADPTAALGSIGVVAVVPDPGRRAKDLTFVSSNAPNKRLDPSSDAGSKAIRAELDAIENVFVSTVARNRGVTTKKVTTDFGRGGIAVGQAAVDAGLADKLGSLEEMIRHMKKKGMRAMRAKQAHEAIQIAAEDVAKEDSMNLIEKIKALIIEGEPTEPEAKAEPTVEPTPEPVDVAALAAERDALAAKLAELEAKKQADDEKAASDAAAEKAARIDAEVKAFMGEHGDKMGKDLREKIEAAYRNAKTADSADRVTEIEAIVSAMPALGSADRIQAGGAAADQKVAQAAGDQPVNPHAAHFETLKRLEAAGVKQGTSEWNQKYQETLVSVQKETGNASA